MRRAFWRWWFGVLASYHRWQEEQHLEDAHQHQDKGLRHESMARYCDHRVAELDDQEA